MQRQRIFAALFGVLLSTHILPCASATKQPHETTANPPWVPTAIPSDVSRLPVGYTGLDIKNVWRHFKSRSEALKKGEFETTEEYEQRISNFDLSPLSRDVEYALYLSMPTLLTKYDADTQKYILTDYIFCQKEYDFGETKGWATCKIGEVERQRSEYLGSNAYGAEARISKTRGTDFAIATPTNSGFLYSNLFKRDKYSEYSSIFKLNGEFFLTIDKAKSLQQYKIGMLLVGKFTSAKIISGKGFQTEPTITKPLDIFISVDAIPFTPTRVIYYVIQTGEILSIQPLTQ